MAKRKRGKHTAYRSARTGRFVPKSYAKRHKSTTVREQVKNANR